MLTLAPWQRQQLRDRSLIQQAAGLVQALLEKFRQVPDEWKDVVIQQVRFFRRLSENPPIRIIGEDEPDK